MKISVVIPVYNEEKRIEKCLLSIIKQSEPVDEIIVVDNNCTDKSMCLVKETAKSTKTKYIKIVKEKKQGIAPARNKGFNNAKYNLIARIDADVRLPKYWVKRVKQYFEKHPSRVGVTGPMCFSDVKFFGSNLLFLSIYSEIVKLIVGHYVFRGGNKVIKKKIWQKLKNKTCLNDNEVMEDLDFSINYSKFGKIGFSSNLWVYGSGRRAIENPKSFYIEYPILFIKTLIKHKLLIKSE